MPDGLVAVAGLHRGMGREIAAADGRVCRPEHSVGGLDQAGIWTVSIRTSPAPQIIAARITITFQA